MNTHTAYMNNFTLSMQHMTVILDAKTTAPDIQNSGKGIPPVFDERRVVEENFVYMPVEVAKELALSLIHVVNTSESRMGFHVNLPKEKQALWEAAVNAIAEEKARHEEA